MNISTGERQASKPHAQLSRVYDDAGNVIETDEHAGDFKEWWAIPFRIRADKNPLTMPATMSRFSLALASDSRI